MEQEFCKYDRKMNDLLHTMHEAMESCNTKTTLELHELDTALANQGEVICNQAVVIDSLRLSLDTCNAKWEQFEREINLVHGKVVSLRDSVCRCARAPSLERVPSPHFSNADSLESYQTLPITSPLSENMVPLPVAVAKAVLDSDAENQAPIAYDTGSEADEAEAFLLEAQRAYHENVNKDNACQLTLVEGFLWLGSTLTLV
jgi:hypothetical protein